MNVCLVYDRVNKWGGAERVLLALNEIFPDAPLYTSVYFPQNTKWAQKFPRIVTSKLQIIPFIRDKHEYLGTLMPLVFESFATENGSYFDEYELVISVTSESAKGINTRGKTKHICYCLTPTRYLWSHYDTYFKGRSFKTLAKPVVSYLRKWDKIAAQRPDVMVAVSSEVQTRIKKYYKRDSVVIYPPLMLKTYHRRSTADSRNFTHGFFLVVSRLVPYKRVDLAVEAFNDLGSPLYIVGTGSEEKKLKKLAKRNIKFLGQLTDEKLSLYYRGARALVMPQEEDFGLVAVEAQSFGVPVIAFKAGGALDIIENGKTGIFFERQNKEDLRNAIKKFEKTKFNARIIKSSVKKFSKENFKKQFEEIVREQIG